MVKSPPERFLQALPPKRESDNSEMRSPRIITPPPATPAMPIRSPARTYAKRAAITGSIEKMTALRVGVVSF